MRRAVPLLLLLAACRLDYGSSRDAEPGVLDGPGIVSVKGCPLLRQLGPMDCGAAALAMVLRHHGRGADLEEIARACDLSPETGIRAGALRDHAKSLGFRSYAFPGRYADLRNELAEGRPVIVGLVKRTTAGPYVHFEVVVGYDPATGLVVTHDPARGLRRNDVHGFFTEWAATDCSTLVVIPP